MFRKTTMHLGACLSSFDGALMQPSQFGQKEAILPNPLDREKDVNANKGAK